MSVDGLEIVASLYLVVQRRAGRSTGWVPWVALIVGTAASLAADVAVGGADPIGKALAPWPPTGGWTRTGTRSRWWRCRPGSRPSGSPLDDLGHPGADAIRVRLHPSVG